ncbi:MAG: phage holin family protein [Rhodothermales bacterium]
MRIKEKQKAKQQAADNSVKEEAAKIDRIAGHTTGLVEDLKSWFELKMEFVLLDFKEEIKSTGLQFAYQAGFFAVLLLAVLFGLTALSFGLGAWLGHPGWGFLSVTGLLVIIALIVKWWGDRANAKKGKVKSYSYSVEEEQRKLSENEASQPVPKELTTKN